MISDDQQRTVTDNDIENVSGKLESFSLSDAIETSLNMQGVQGVQGVQVMQAPTQEPRKKGKREAREAALESGSNVVPREMARISSSGQVNNGGLLDTPNCSGQITGEASSYNLNNCRQLNDL